MNIKKEELLHIAKLAHLKLDDNEIDKYLLNLQDILNYADVVNNANTEGLKETIGAKEKSNVFRKDDVQEFGDRDILLQNAPEQEDGMISIPKVIN